MRSRKCCSSNSCNGSRSRQKPKKSSDGKPLTLTSNVENIEPRTTRKGENMKMLQRRLRQTTHWKSPFHSALLIGVMLASPAGAAPGDKFDVLRDLAGRVGAVVGSALTCKEIA